MGRLLVALSGFLFATGLAVAGMTDANKVLGFLDLTHGWDPSLALVMVGAIGVHALAVRFILGRRRPWFAQSFSLPAERNITGRLVTGSVLFGVGWGLAGYCPGPVLVSSVTGALAPLMFVATMTAGWLLTARLERPHIHGRVGEELSAGDPAPLL
jgi:uncharacterized membrane protein YedE/YeeE